MDRTRVFNEIINELNDNNIEQNESNFLKKFHSKHKSKIDDRDRNNFNFKLRELISSITYMRDYLLANKKDYLNIYNSILSMTSTMTDEERDQIDKDVLDFVKLCTDVIKILRVETRSKSSTQQYEHQNNAIDLAETYIKRINEIHNRNKALRLRKNLDSQNFFRLNRSAVENKGNFRSK
ncbi:hypothetical protein SSS_09991 [Sarcoptes scabiei]|nr:hypothetical protein SSS_09991 [Sarcoptes scabiei]